MRNRKLQAKKPIVWSGDLDDDCTAIWAGLMLRAEKMDENDWWWAVYDMKKKEITIDCSNERKENYTNGIGSRAEAEKVARKYIDSL